MCGVILTDIRTVNSLSLLRITLSTSNEPTQGRVVYGMVVTCGISNGSLPSHTLS